MNIFKFEGDESYCGNCSEPFQSQGVLLTRLATEQNTTFTASETMPVDPSNARVFHWVLGPAERDMLRQREEHRCLRQRPSYEVGTRSRKSLIRSPLMIIAKDSKTEQKLFQQTGIDSIPSCMAFQLGLRHHSDASENDRFFGEDLNDGEDCEKPVGRRWLGVELFGSFPITSSQRGTYIFVLGVAENHGEPLQRIFTSYYQENSLLAPDHSKIGRIQPHFHLDGVPAYSKFRGLFFRMHAVPVVQLPEFYPMSPVGDDEAGPAQLTLMIFKVTDEEKFRFQLPIKHGGLYMSRGPGPARHPSTLCSYSDAGPLYSPFVGSNPLHTRLMTLRDLFDRGQMLPQENLQLQTSTRTAHNYARKRAKIERGEDVEEKEKEEEDEDGDSLFKVTVCGSLFAATSAYYRDVIVRNNRQESLLRLPDWAEADVVLALKSYMYLNVIQPDFPPVRFSQLFLMRLLFLCDFLMIDGNICSELCRILCDLLPFTSRGGGMIRALEYFGRLRQLVQTWYKTKEPGKAERVLDGWNLLNLALYHRSNADSSANNEQRKQSIDAWNVFHTGNEIYGKLILSYSERMRKAENCSLPTIISSE